MYSLKCPLPQYDMLLKYGIKYANMVLKWHHVVNAQVIVSLAS